MSREKTLEFMKKAGIPRFVGSPGEKEVKQLIKTEFMKILGVEPSLQPFSVSTLYMNGLLNIVHPILGLLMITIFILNFVDQIIPALLIAAILFILATFNRQIIYWFQFRLQKYGKQIPTENIIYEILPKEEILENIVILAHTDSISHVIPPIWESIGYISGFIGGFLYSIHSLVVIILTLSNPEISISPWSLVWGMPFALITFMELFNKKQNKSLGILDNVSALGQMHSFAQSVVENPLNKTKVWLVATGAEELGDYGAYYFIEKYKDHFPKASTRFIIPDSFGTKTSNQIVYGIGLPIRHYSPTMERISRNVLRKKSYPLKMLAIPPLLQVATDHVPIDNAGYECMIIMSSNFVIHGEKDNWDSLDLDIHSQICEYIEEIIRTRDIELKEKN